MRPTVTYEDICAAQARIGDYAHVTPVLASTLLDRATGASLSFKCENLQRTGAFKFRGACNSVFSLTEAEAARGVATHSSGNHGAALACAAALRSIPAAIVMPRGASRAKAAAVEAYGGRISWSEPTLRGREAALDRLTGETGAVFIPPYNDCRVIAGQGTAAAEFLAQAGPLDLLLAPIGGGGLLAGSAVAAAQLSPATRVIGVEPAGADDARRAFHSGIIEEVTPDTIADGLRATIGEINLGIIRQHVADIVTVSEQAIVQAMRLVWERMKLVVEPSAAVPLAALLEGKIDARGKRVGIILSGGNVDLDALPW